MNGYIISLLPILLPIISGVVLLLAPVRPSRRQTHIYTLSAMICSVICALYTISQCRDVVTIYTIIQPFSILLQVDALSQFFILIVSIVWLLVTLYSFTYMQHENNEKRYFGFWISLYGILMGLGMSANLLTMYAFYELMTLCSFPLVLHNQSRESIMAALKYLFYSFFGAYMALFGLFVLMKYLPDLSFTPGGILAATMNHQHPMLLMLAILFMLMGFGVKAGVFPMHAWLPVAHPVAPAPASAVLSGIIVKGGIFAIIRVIFYIVGTDYIRGTWVQTIFLTLSLFTVFMGSMLAYHARVLKKRLAYSTVSQLSYIVFGILLLNPVSTQGALLHMAAHAFIKCALFLIAGIIIFQTGATTVDEMDGIGKKMPITMWCYTIVSLGLIGIPPTSGFISKWYLATGALDSGLYLFQYLGPVILLLSALLTAGYLLPLTIHGFFPGRDFDYSNLKHQEPGLLMLIPVILLTIFTLLIGICPEPFIRFLTQLTDHLWI